MSLSDRIDKIKFILNPEPQQNLHVVMAYSYQTKDEALQEYEQTNNIKTSPSDRFVYIQIVPDENGEHCEYRQTQFFKKYDKQIKDLFRNKGYSMDRIVNEFLDKGF